MSDRVQESADIDEVDLGLVNALQVDPRAPWTRVGRALELDPVTVARRWSRMADAGLAWVTPQLGHWQAVHVYTAVVEVDCEAGRAFEVADTLVSWSHVVTVEHTTGGRDLLATVAVPSLADLSRYLNESVGALPGVRATRSQLVTRIYAQGGDWRLRALAPDQRAHRLTEQDQRLILRLCVDGRTSLADLGAEIGVSLSTARRRLNALLTSGELKLRCELAQPLSGWPISTWMWAHVPADARDTIARRLVDLPETRVCLALTGSRANLAYGASLRSLDDVQRLEQWLAEHVPQLTIVDQSVVLRFAKRMGRVLDSAGRAVDIVPLDVWSSPFPSAPHRS